MEPGDLVRIRKEGKNMVANYFYSSLSTDGNSNTWLKIDWDVHAPVCLYLGEDQHPKYEREYFTRLLWGNRIVWIEPELVEPLKNFEGKE